MQIKTITCHDVYNVGASLQAYALYKYLSDCGHDVEIIDYKPNYLSRHYSLTSIDNPKYNIPLIRIVYLLAKLPFRIRSRMSERKKNFDSFKKDYLKITNRRYKSYQMLKEEPPIADIYLAGSDQIWNPIFQNGKDPAFYLNFAPKNKIRASYAASFATSEISEVTRRTMQSLLENLDVISIREKSGVKLLNEMGFEGQVVCDPVFLLSQEMWKNIAVTQIIDDSILLYDFDTSETIQEIARKIAKDNKKKIFSFFPSVGVDRILKGMGPREFLGAILNASVVISNSFHATAFSLIFHKDFYVINRHENINSRMSDLLASVGLKDRLVQSVADIENVSPIEWNVVDEQIKNQVDASKKYLTNVINMVGKSEEYER